MSSIRAISCVLFVVACAAQASAQTSTLPSSTPVFASAQNGPGGGSPQRQGFWFSGGLGVGFLTCEDHCGEGNKASGIADVVFGGTLGDRLLLGGAITGWTKTDDRLEVSLRAVEARVRFYPSAQKGLFLAGGLGVGSISHAGGNGSDNKYGPSVTLGLGWDLRVSQNVSITPFWQGTSVLARYNVAHLGSLGVAVTIH